MAEMGVPERLVSASPATAAISAASQAVLDAKAAAAEKLAAARAAAERAAAARAAAAAAQLAVPPSPRVTEAPPRSVLSPKVPISQPTPTAVLTPTTPSVLPPPTPSTSNVSLNTSNSTGLVSPPPQAASHSVPPDQSTETRGDSQTEILAEINSVIRSELSFGALMSLLRVLEAHVKAVDEKLVMSSEDELRGLCHQSGFSTSLANVPAGKPRSWYVDWIVTQGRIRS
eukprot:TRINITY_DN951_c0_g2_i4.p1 TRINITY_DN951_c0_g2~~TRINITY_DN951_c0_g2_i4.p1  ORF type:complete len:229 (+),score=55.36 TRINITY_DN951_c0_g2_i4:799-1485(+)